MALKVNLTPIIPNRRRRTLPTVPVVETADKCEHRSDWLLVVNGEVWCSVCGALVSKKRGVKC